jgi:hypothetical protein
MTSAEDSRSTSLNSSSLRARGLSAARTIATPGCTAETVDAVRKPSAKASPASIRNTLGPEGTRPERTREQAERVQPRYDEPALGATSGDGAREARVTRHASM